jgi:hypothetical protein
MTCEDDTVRTSINWSWARRRIRHTLHCHGPWETSYCSGDWRPGYRHQVTWDALPCTCTPPCGQWRCVDCGQTFDSWPDDSQACPGPPKEAR